MYMHICVCVQFYIMHLCAYGYVCIYVCTYHVFPDIIIMLTGALGVTHVYINALVSGDDRESMFS